MSSPAPDEPRGVIAWFVRNPVAANLLMAVIVFGGGMAALAVNREVFPEISADMISVSVAYPGAAPEEVEQAICLPIEEAVQGIDGVKRITANANESAGSVSIEVLEGYDLREVLDDVKSQVDGILTFPENAERPLVSEVQIPRQVIYVGVAGEADELTLKRIGERVRDDLLAMAGITQVDLGSARPYEVSIEVSEEALRRYGLTFEQVAAAVRRSSVDLPGGSVRTGGGEVLLRTLGQAYRGEEFEQLVVIAAPDGTRVTLGEVATVVDGFAETDQSARFDGRQAVVVRVYRVGDQDVLKIAGAVRDYVAGARAWVPEGVELITWRDRSQMFEGRLDLLLRNGINGLLLVVAVLALFLHLRVSLWVSLGIPVSFLGAVWLMPSLGVSLNMVSMFAFILVLGIVVDDAIVIGENIHACQERTGSGTLGAILGAREMAVPVVFAVLTTVAAFVPLLIVPGTMGKVFRVIPLVVIPCLLWSLGESLLVLPAHLSHRQARPGPLTRWFSPVQRIMAAGLERFVERVYRPLLAAALGWRYLAVSLFVGVLVLAAGYVASGRMKVVFFPDVESDFVTAKLTMPLGVAVETTSRALERMERAALELNDHFRERNGGDVVRHVMATIGAQNTSGGGPHGGPQTSASHLGEVTLELYPAEDRVVSSRAVERRWREQVGHVPDAVELTYVATMASAGNPINIQLKGPDLGTLQRVAGELKAQLATYDGVYSIADSFRGGKPEVKIAVEPEAETLGLTVGAVGAQVRHGFYGAEAQRILRDREEVRVMVRYPLAARRSLGDLEAMRLRTSDGHEVPISRAARLELGRGFASIKRVDRDRVINVTADIDRARTDARRVLGDLKTGFLADLVARTPGLAYSLEGEQRDMADVVRSLKRSGLLALVAIFALMAVPFRSYLQPAIVMSAIPFGLLGAIIGHVLMGLELSLMSMMGLVALTGVVVNDSLVMVDYINRRRTEGAPLMEAVSRSGEARFRAIMLTSVTTFAGLTPLLLERSTQAKFLIPMAVSLAFGVMFATFVTLLLVPCIYVILEDVRGAVGRLWGGRAGPERGAAEVEV